MTTTLQWQGIFLKMKIVNNKMPVNIFFASKSLLVESDVECLLQALITYGDTIWLQDKTIEMSIQYSKLNKQIFNTLNGIREAKILSTWGLEGSKCREIPDKVVTIEEQEELYERVNYHISTNSVEGHDGRFIKSKTEMVTRFIELRKTLWDIQVASKCESSGIVVGESQFNGNCGNANNYLDLNAKMAKELFNAFSLPPLATIKVEQLLDIRADAKLYRNRIDAIVADLIRSKTIPNNHIFESCRSVYREYLDDVGKLIEDRIGANWLIGLGGNIVTNILGIFLPIIGFLPLANKIQDWLANRNQYGFMLYMIKLEKATKALP